MSKIELLVLKDVGSRKGVEVAWQRLWSQESGMHALEGRVCLESRCTSGWQGPGGLGARLSNGVVSMGFEPKADRAHSSLWKQLFSKCLELSWKQAEFKL